MPVPSIEALRDQARRVVEEATRRGRTFALVESCTGGFIASLITDVPGASVVFRGAWIPYHDDLKARELEVPEETIRMHGVVSAEVARALAAAARDRAGADHALATTGILGPTGGTPTKPVGLVWIGLAGASGARAVRCQNAGERLANKHATAAEALRLLLAEITAAAPQASA